MLTIAAPSPNSAPRRLPARAIVVHATAASTAKSTLSWFASPVSRVSAHYLIDKDGTTYLCVPESRVAWHAGVSSWRGLEIQKTLNPVSVGVELVNRNDGADEYPARQIDSLIALLAWICVRHSIDAANICGHYECSTGRKTDPRGLDMDAVRARVAQVIAAARGGGGDAHHAMDDVTRETVRAMIASALTPITLRLDAVDRTLATTMRSIERIEYMLYGDQRADAAGLAQRINHIEEQIDNVISSIDSFSSTMRGAKAAFAALAAAMTALSAPDILSALARLFGGAP